MASKQELQVQQKRELERKEEATVPTRTFFPTADHCCPVDGGCDSSITLQDKGF